MPKPIDPSSTYEYVLEADRTKPAPEQPKFFLRVLSARKWRQASAELDKVVDVTGGPVDRISLMGSIISLSLVDWSGVTSEGQSIPFDLKSIEDVLSPAEMTELALATIRNGELSADEKKSSESPPSSTSDSSAVAADQASASTAPASTSQP